MIPNRLWQQFKQKQARSNISHQTLDEISQVKITDMFYERRFIFYLSHHMLIIRRFFHTSPSLIWKPRLKNSLLSLLYLCLSSSPLRSPHHTSFSLPSPLPCCSSSFLLTSIPTSPLYFSSLPSILAPPFFPLPCMPLYPCLSFFLSPPHINYCPSSSPLTAIPCLSSSILPSPHLSLLFLSCFCPSLSSFPFISNLASLLLSFLS